MVIMKSLKETSSEGYTYVTSKRRRNRRYKGHPGPVKSDVASKQSFTKDLMDEIQNELKCSQFFINFKQNLLSVIEESRKSSELSSNTLDSSDFIKSANNENINSIKGTDIVCYGLGKFFSCPIARYQLGFLTALQHDLQTENVYIYDPQFSTEENTFLENLGFEIIKINEQAVRSVNCKTIFFMPHCELPLYNNLLWSNWNVNSLLKLIIIGNSFHSYDCRTKLEKKAKYVYLANSFLNEIKIANDFRFTDVFNDLSIHYFKSEALSDVPADVWSQAEKPEYSDEELIKLI
ncbi:SRR1-like protein, partial [Stegodyphus mimosarum]